MQCHTEDHPGQLWQGSLLGSMASGAPKELQYCLTYTPPEGEALKTWELENMGRGLVCSFTPPLQSWLQRGLKSVGPQQETSPTSSSW